jgi:hypothetical protein
MLLTILPMAGGSLSRPVAWSAWSGCGSAGR